MALSRFDMAALRPMPWKNGGGTTREIVCIARAEGLGRTAAAKAMAEASSGEPFDWRVSIATIDRAGPFSAFAGIDRTIMLLEGAGVRLRSRDGAIDHALDTPLAPFAFSGDVALDCELLGGASTDFNVMTRRGRLRAEVCVLREGGDVAACDAGLLLALNGRWRLRTTEGTADDIASAPGTGLWWDGASHGWHADPLDAGAALVAVRIEAASTSSGG